MSSLFHYLLTLLINNPEDFEYISRRNLLDNLEKSSKEKSSKFCPDCFSVIRKSLMKCKLHSGAHGNPTERLEIIS